jgi:hypothetical protein
MKVDEIVTDCCGARFYYPDYPDNDICTECKEHAFPFKEEFSDESTWKAQEEYLHYRERRPED